jgi:hypothetical protein
MLNQPTIYALHMKCVLTTWQDPYRLSDTKILQKKEARVNVNFFDEENMNIYVAQNTQILVKLYLNMDLSFIGI